MWGTDTYPGESFPALLSLGDPETRRPGFLRLLGSSEVNDKDNSTNMLAERLPGLEQAEFFNLCARHLICPLRYLLCTG
jgi:hypothetical protein